MENPYMREAGNLQSAFVGTAERIIQPEITPGKKMSFKQLVAEFTDLSFPTGKGAKAKIEWAENNFGDRISAEDYGNVPKNNRRAWKKWKKLISAAIIEDNQQPIDTIEPVVRPEVVAPEPEVTVNPMPPAIELPEPSEGKVEVKEPEIIVNPMPPVVGPGEPTEGSIVAPTEPEIIVNPMPPVVEPEELTVDTTKIVGTVEPVIDPVITVNPMPPVVGPGEPTEGSVIAPVEPEIIVNPMPPVVGPGEPTEGKVVEPTEPEIIVNPMPPQLEITPVDEPIFGTSQGPEEQFFCGHCDLEPLNLDDLLIDDLDLAINQLSPAMAANTAPAGSFASFDLGQPSEELVKQEVQVDI